jgi:CheY-like chemotaxis protein
MILEGEALRLVVLDLYVPGLAGWDLLDVVRSYVRFSDLPVLIISGMPEYGLTLRYRATRFLAKPFRPELLEQAVHELLAATGGAGPAERGHPS